MAQDRYHWESDGEDAARTFYVIDTKATKDCDVRTDCKTKKEAQELARDLNEAWLQVQISRLTEERDALLAAARIALSSGDERSLRAAIALCEGREG